MQEFLRTDTVNCNLMSLTGYRTLVLLDLLMQAPKTNDEINECFLKNRYIQETFSIDTLRIYVNSLRTIGCEITKANKSTNNRYKLIAHPFNIDISKSKLKALTKLYKAIYDKIDVSEAIALEELFLKIAAKIKNEETKSILFQSSMLKNIDRKILYEILSHCKNKHQFSFLYNSPRSGKKKIEIIADKISFQSQKLYLWGYSLMHDEYSYFRVDRILEIGAVKIKNEAAENKEIKVRIEIKKKGEYCPEPDETILEYDDGKYLVEICTANKFNLMQRLLYMGKDCKILSPNEFKDEYVQKLKLMKEAYL